MKNQSNNQTATVIHLNTDCAKDTTKMKMSNDKTALQQQPQTRLQSRLHNGVLVACLMLGVYLLSALPSAFASGPDSNPLTHWDTRYNYFLRFPAAAQHGIRDQNNPQGGHDVVENQQSMGPGTVIHEQSGQVFAWPVTIEHAQSQVPTFRDEGISENLFQTFGYPVSDTQFQVIERYNHNRFLEQLFDPEKAMWMSTTIAGVMANSAGNSTANMGVNQCINAIDYVRQPLGNFTAEAGNIWQRIRYELFIPMAVLLLLPGAALAQVRAIVAQGSGILGDVSPFEGLLRSVIAVFLIPGSFLVINYGIDVSNSLTFTIADEYHRMFGSDMYQDAKCAITRSMPINTPSSNRNAIDKPKQAPVVNHDVWSSMESHTLATRLYDPCVPVDQSRLPDEDVNASMMINRLCFNTTIASLGLSWNIYCAFQMVFLYYLWCMGPVSAALWVWPIPRLRQAFGAWVEGVIILCFWALFWNTSIFLLAAFKGVGDTGTVYCCAIVFLCVQSVKSAFDFVSLVSSAASGADQMAQAAMQQLTNAAPKAGGGKDSGGGGGASGAGGAGGGVRGGGGAPSPASGAGTAGAIGGPGGAGPVPKGGLGQSLSVSPSPMATAGAGGGGSGAPGGAKGGAAGPEGGPGGGMGAGSGGGDAAGMGGAKPEVGLPPGGGPDGGKGEAAGAASAALGGALSGLGGGGGAGGGAGAPPMSSAAYAMSKSVTNLGGDANLGDLSQMRNLGDNSLMNNLNEAGGKLGLPPMAGELTNAAMGQAGNALFGAEGPLSGLDNKAMSAASMLAGGPEGLANVAGDFAHGNPLGKDLALDQMHASGSQRDVMANGIDAAAAGNPQAEMARASTQDLMKASGVDDGTLNRALQGDANAAGAIQDKLGVSPMTLDLARGGDPGAAALTMEAAGRNAVEHARAGDNAPMEALNQAAQSGSMAAQDALNVASIPMSQDALQQRESLVHAAAVDNNPAAARELLGQNGEQTVAAMASSQAVTQELSQAGVTPEQFRQALAGDSNMQNMVSEQMGGASFDKVQGAYYGNAGDAATTMVARGNAEMQTMQSQGMSSDQIQNYARQNGDVALMAAESVNNCTPQGTFERAMSGEQAAQREMQQAISSNPMMLEAAYSGSSQARAVVEGATGQDATVMGAASHNAQAVLSQMSGDSRSVEQALNGSAQQRESYVQQAAQELGVSPRVLNEALGGGSLESGTVMARAGQIAEAGNSGGNYQLSPAQQRLAEGLQEGNNLMVAAQATYSAVSNGGQDTQTLSYAAQGSESYALAAASAIQSSQEVRSLGSSDADSIMQSSSCVTHSGSEAVGNFTVANPTYALNDASVTAQYALRDAGIDPQTVVSGVRSGDPSELNRAATTFGVTPDVIQGALMRGDSGDAITLVGAAGRQLIAQGPDAVQQASQTESGQLALHVAQSTPQNVLSQAMAGNDVAQAQMARSVASDPQVLASASTSDSSYRAVGSTLGEGAPAAVYASSTAQEMVSMHPNHDLVERALYAQGSDQQVAMQQLSQDMNVSPQVLSNALSGSGPDLSAMVAASSAGLHNTVNSGHASSAYFGNLAREASGGTSELATAINAAGYGQSPSSINMAGYSSPGAQEAVRATMEMNPQLSNLAREGQNHSASAIITAAAYSMSYQPNYDAGSSAIVQNLRPSDPVYGITAQNHQMDRGNISSSETFTAHSGGQHNPMGHHQEHMPARYTGSESYGMSGTDAVSRPVPPDSVSYSQPSQDIRSSEPTGGWFDGGRSDGGSGPKLSDAAAGATPNITPGAYQNRSLAPQNWQGAQGRDRDRKAQNDARIAELKEQARRAREANDQYELEAIRRNLKRYGYDLDA